MPQFDKQSAERISNTVRGWERRLRGRKQNRGRWEKPRYTTVAFELLEAYEQFSTTPALAVVRTWNATLNSGLGGYESDCTNGKRIKVWDAFEVGYTAGIGGLGRAKIVGDFGGYDIGHIYDLCCPGDEQGECTGGSGSGS